MSVFLKRPYIDIKIKEKKKRGKIKNTFLAILTISHDNAFLIINLLEFSTISNFTNDDTHLVEFSAHGKNLSYTDCQS